MPVNSNKPERWKPDIAQSIDFYNDWFMSFAPETYRQARREMTEQVDKAIKNTNNLTRITPQMLREYPQTLSMLRMATAPPIARDRLSGLAYIGSSIINRMEKEGKLPERLTGDRLEAALSSICNVIDKLLDRDIFPWLENSAVPTPEERERAATVIADRLSGATADPIIRNAQERRQLKAIETYLGSIGYKYSKLFPDTPIDRMEAGTFTFRFNVVAGTHQVNIPIDAIVQPLHPKPNRLPILIEAKSAGDFTNTNKRRKEEATKMRQLSETLGDTISFILFLNGYFDSGYLGYEAAEGIDWVWEHRIEDLEEFGV